MKLQHGEYVSLGKVESQLKNHPGIYTLLFFLILAANRSTLHFFEGGGEGSTSSLFVLKRKQKKIFYGQRTLPQNLTLTCQKLHSEKGGGGVANVTDKGFDCMEKKSEKSKEQIVLCSC